MSMHTLVVCLEEPSARNLLEAILPKLMPENWSPAYIVFQGKHDLLDRLEFRIRHWNVPDSSFLVMCDQDSDDCRELKQRVAEIVARAGKLATAKIRIACHELENFYLGDLRAVEQGLSVVGVSKLSQKSIYRVPDDLHNAPEQLKKITRGCYQKCAGSRAIAPYLNLSGENNSMSFNMLVRAVRELTAAEADNGNC